MKIRKTVIKMPAGTPGEKVLKLLEQGGARVGEVWNTQDDGLTWKLQGKSRSIDELISYDDKRRKSRRKVSV